MNPITITDHVSQQSDRYLFLLVLVIAGVSVYFAVRYLVTRIEKQNELLTGLFKEANDGRVECAKNIAANSVIVTEATETIRESRDAIRDCTAFLRKGLPLILAGLLLSGCAARSYEAPDGTKLRSVTLLLKSRVESVAVTTNGLRIIGASNAADAKAIEAAAEGAMKGAKGF